MADNKSNSIKQKLVRGKLSAFLICLLLSSFLWISHRLNQSYNYTINVPVKFVNLPTNKILLSDLPSHLRCDIKTSGLKLFFVLLNKPFSELTIDFNSLKGDNKFQTYALNYESINLKTATKLDVNIKKLSPDTLFFANKQGVTKTVAIKSKVYAQAEKGYVISKPNLNPLYISISGDSTALKEIDSISTAPLYLSQLSGNYNGKVKLIRPSENIFLNVHEVNVSVQVDKILEKQIEIPIIVTNLPIGHEIKLFPSKVKVTYSAAKNDFSDISPINFKAFVNYNKHKINHSKLPIELSLIPTQAKILMIEPSELEFVIFK